MTTSTLDASAPSLRATMEFWPADGPSMLSHPPIRMDLRKPGRTRPHGVGEAVSVPIADARAAVADLGLDTSGFACHRVPTAVTDWFDTEQVMAVYYEECRSFARELLGASHAFTFDHLIREPGSQTSGGGTDGSTRVTGVEAGGGYIAAVHMDYTTETTWARYLALHGVTEPADATRVVVLNFWRPLCEVVEDHPLAVCDARSVAAEDLQEVLVYGYGAENYSWHEIGIPTYSVKASERQRWYYYPRMTADETLVIKSYDSRGVVGGACPHASFALADAPADAAPRRSIELRVLCYVGAKG